MIAEPSTLALPRDSCRFTLQNDSDTQLYSTPGSYQLFVYTGSRWEFIVPKVGAGVGHTPTEIKSHEWVLHVNTADLGAFSPPRENGEQSLTFRFPPGTYAFGFRVSSKGSDSKRMYTTKFTVEGETPPLVPSDSVVSHSRQGNTLKVTTQAENQYSNSHRVSLLLKRSSATKQMADLTLLELYNPIYEQVPSYDSAFVDPLLTELLRDGFAFMKPSDENIHIHTIDTTIPPLGMSEDDSLSVKYGETTWELTTKKGWA